MVKTHPYNRQSLDGKRLYKLLDSRPVTPTPASNYEKLHTFQTNAVMQCRIEKMDFLIPDNLAKIERPQVRVQGNVEDAWGDFGSDTDTGQSIDALTFSNGQELPVTYVQSMDDDTLKLLIDAGMYRDPRFEVLMQKLASGDTFEVETELGLARSDVYDAEADKHTPVLLAEPISFVDNSDDPSQQTSINDVVKRSARLAIELRKEGVQTEELVNADNLMMQDQEVVVDDYDLQDTIDLNSEVEQQQNEALVEKSELLDKEIDLSDELDLSNRFGETTEDDKIRMLKEERERQESYEQAVNHVTNEKSLSPYEKAIQAQEAKKKKQSGAIASLEDEPALEDDGPEF